METIGEEAISSLPPPNAPLAAIPSREDVMIRPKGGKKGKKKDGFTDFDKPFSNDGDQQQDEIEEMHIVD